VPAFRWPPFVWPAPNFGAPLARFKACHLPLQAAKDSVRFQPARSGCDNRASSKCLLKFGFAALRTRLLPAAQALPVSGGIVQKQVHTHLSLSIPVGSLHFAQFVEGMVQRISPCQSNSKQRRNILQRSVLKKPQPYHLPCFSCNCSMQ